MFSGRSSALNSLTNLLTDDIELRSTSRISIFAVGTCLRISSLTRSAADGFLTPIMTCTPRNARTQHVSAPIPLDASVCRKLFRQDGHHQNSRKQHNLSSRARAGALLMLNPRKIYAAVELRANLNPLML